MVTATTSGQWKSVLTPDEYYNGVHTLALRVARASRACPLSPALPCRHLPSTHLCCASCWCLLCADNFVVGVQQENKVPADYIGCWVFPWMAPLLVCSFDRSVRSNGPFLTSISFDS